jgi:hypothetical protein
MSNHLIGQPNAIFFVHVDSVLAYSFLDKERIDFTDSIYQYHYECLSKEVDFFMEDAYHTITNYNNCCSCTREDMNAEGERIIAIQKSLQKQEKGLNLIAEIVKNRYQYLVLTLVQKLASQYAKEISTAALIIDSSSAQVYPGTGSSTYCLTSQIIKEIENNATLKIQIMELEHSMASEIEKIICEE